MTLLLISPHPSEELNMMSLGGVSPDFGFEGLSSESSGTVLQTQLSRANPPWTYQHRGSGVCHTDPDQQKTRVLNFGWGPF